jgi:hypothetical protein
MVGTLGTKPKYAITKAVMRNAIIFVAPVAVAV